jgi:hypothetical protein
MGWRSAGSTEKIGEWRMGTGEIAVSKIMERCFKTPDQNGQTTPNISLKSETRGRDLEPDLMPNKIFLHGSDGKLGLEKALLLGFR